MRDVSFKIVRIMFYNMLCLLIASFLSCSKSSGNPQPDPPVDPPVVVEADPAQYGTPYTSVPQASDVVMYQVNMRAFSKEGTLKAVQARLDSIKALGVNVVYLMPVYPVGAVKSVNSPYCVKDYKSVATEFGTLDDLRSLVADAHTKGMAVIMDWVANHTSWDNSWISNKSWYKQDASGNIISPPNTGWNDVAQLNFDNSDMRKAMIKAMKYWVYTANVDGFRCDAADFVPYDFWQQAIDTLRNISTHQLLMYAEGTRKDQFNAGFQLKYGMGFYYTMKDRVFAAGQSAKLIDSLNVAEYTNSTTATQVVRYLSNHDVDAADGSPIDLFGGKNGSLALFTIAAYMKGVPMIYNGQEVGCPVKLSYFNNTTNIDWTINPEIKAAYKNIIAFRNASNALKTGTLTSYSSDDVCVFTKESGGEKVLVLANFRNKAIDYSVPSALNNSNWKNAFDGSAVPVSSTISLQPYQYLVLKN